MIFEIIGFKSINMKVKFLFPFILHFISLASESYASKILFLTPFGSKSHKDSFMVIAEALANVGHQITAVSTYSPSKSKKNIHEIVLPTADATSILDQKIYEGGSAEKLMGVLLAKSIETCSEGLLTKEIAELKKEKFDLIVLSMFFDMCYLSLVHHFQVPFVYASPGGLIGPMASMVGSLELPAVEKNVMFEGSDFPYPFFDRLRSILSLTGFGTYFHHWYLPKMEEVCKETGACPADMPSFNEINNHVSLVLLNTVKSLEYPPMPTMPNVKHFGGIHCHPAKPLPKDLEDFVSGAEHGVIFFSLGSALKPSDMPESHREILLKVFGSLKQRILLKWDEATIKDLPLNIKTSKWFPQQDILGHKNAKLFITHGGLHSTLEATYHGIPIVGMPVYGDQASNIATAVSEGWASSFRWEDLDENKLRNVIEQTIADQSIKEKLKQRSILMRDRPGPVVDEVVYWIEYVLRHNGADHIKSPLLKLKFYQVYNMDVYATLLIILLTTLYIVSKIFSCILSLCCGKKNDNKATKKKKKE